MISMTNEFVIEKATQLGFNLVGFAKVEELKKETNHLNDWLKLDYHADMNYMSKNFEKRKDVKNILNTAESVISLGLNYYVDEVHSQNNRLGKISRYAWGKDYHLIIWEKLNKLIENLKSADPEFEAISYVDTGPVMDKAWAVKAGLGWLGKHTNVINRNIGSWFFIANIICNKTFKYDVPIEDYCGSCTACIDACPTNAIVKPYVLDSNKCISYLTIENKGEISKEFKNKFDNWIFGCDICQEVCPWNEKFSVKTLTEDFYPKNNNKEIELHEISQMSQIEFSKKFKNSPIKRTKLEGLKRNAAFISDSK